MALTGMLFLIGAAFAAPTLSAATPFELERARETLKISQAARDRIAGELSDLKASGNASPEVLSAYETYLARVQEMVDENQKALAQMEAAYSAHQARPQAAAAGTPAIAGAAPPSAGPGEDPADRLKVLDRQFNESLASFDEMLLKELRLIQAASAKRMQGLSEAAAEAGRQAGEKGSTTETAGSGTAGGGSEKEGAGTEQAKTSEGSGKPGGAAGSGQGTGGTGAPAGSYTPSPDDDIVARQLREAAEKETDPDLKAKLWKEYEAYKRSRAKP
ncbi:MAG TPA: hypothetical protein VLR50_15895 [Desulfobacterales bacterium]|nr:hypothetical protein [Desulfobacterales bacterium]